MVLISHSRSFLEQKNIFTEWKPSYKSALNCRADGKQNVGTCRNETCVLCQAKNGHQRCHCSIVKNLTQSANPFLKNQNHAKKWWLSWIGSCLYYHWQLLTLPYLYSILPTLRSITFWVVTMEIQSQKVPCRMKLHRELTICNNSIIYKIVELKFSMDTYSGPLISENNINHIPHGIFCITDTLGGGRGADSSCPL